MNSQRRGTWQRIIHYGILAVGAVALTASACAENDGSVFVVQVMAPPTPAADGTCTYTNSPTSAFLGGGTLDVGLATSYSPVMLLGNQLVARGNAQESRVETNRVQIQGSVVRVTDAAGTELRSYTVPASGFIDVASGTTPGYGLASTTLVDPDTAASLRTALAGSASTRTLISYVKFFGQTLGGTHVESGEYQFPIAVCYGCLVSFPPGSTDASQPTPNCKNAIGGSSGGTVATPCRLGQDQVSDCRLCQGISVCTP